MLDDWNKFLQFTTVIRKLEWMRVRGAFGSLWRQSLPNIFQSNYRILVVLFEGSNLKKYCKVYKMHQSTRVLLLCSYLCTITIFLVCLLCKVHMFSVCREYLLDLAKCALYNSLQFGMLCPIMQCSWLDFPFPVWWINWILVLTSIFLWLINVSYWQMLDKIWWEMQNTCVLLHNVFLYKSMQNTLQYSASISSS